MFKHFAQLITFMFVWSLSGCGSDSTEELSNEADTGNNVITTSGLVIGITDAPIDEAKSVVVTIKRIEIKRQDDDQDAAETDNETESDTDTDADTQESTDEGTDSDDTVEEDAEESEEGEQADNGWLIYFDAQTEEDEVSIDLLEYANGKVALFDEVEFEVGSYGQIRIYLADGEGKNTITLMDDSVNELDLNPGIKNNGLKLVSGFEIQAGVLSEITLDFDVRKSIVVKGGKKNPRYALKPTIRLIQNSLSGNIVVTKDVAAADEVYYLYPAGFDVADEASATVVDDMGTPEDETDDEEVASPYVNAVSSVISFDDEGTFKALFSFIPYGEYDVYVYDTESDALVLVSGDVSLTAEDEGEVVVE